MDLVQDLLQTLPFPVVYPGDKADAAFEMRLEVGMIFPVLAHRTQPDTVRQSCLQEVEVVAAHIQPLVDYQTGEMLADALPHEAGLVVVDAEALFGQDDGGMGGEAQSAAGKLFVAGKGEVVGVAGIVDA